mmetsp:Transcript_7985/g.16624  ORF Transcript_7985/g.16624 Transcript_7985/m.16624 type:complete len:91 (-) Transcript_7985:756-1028(-)
MYCLIIFVVSLSLTHQDAANISQTWSLFSVVDLTLTETHHAIAESYPSFWHLTEINIPGLHLLELISLFTSNSRKPSAFKILHIVEQACP